MKVLLDTLFDLSKLAALSALLGVLRLVAASRRVIVLGSALLGIARTYMSQYYTNIHSLGV